MHAIFTLLAVVFAAKLAWNVSLPFWLERRRGVSLHVHVELGLLLAMMLVAARPVLVGVVGAAAIAASYGGAIGVGALLGWRYTRP